MALSQSFFLEQPRQSSHRDPVASFISMAARFGDVITLQKMLREAVESDAHFIKSPTIGLALKRAIQAGHIEVLQCLLEEGADINTKFKGASALHETVKMNNLRVLQFLLNVPGLKRDTFSLAQKTPLMEAACRGRIECLNMLLGKGCKVNARNSRGLTAVHYCMLPSIGTVDAEDTATCLNLLYNTGADVDAQDNFGNSPLHIAIMTENLEALVWLLQHNCKLNILANPPDLAPGIFSSIENSVPLTPCMMALHFSNRRVVELLVTCGCYYYNMGWTLPYCRQYKLLHEFLAQSLTTPHSLKLSCRIIIRQCLGRHIQEKINQLDFLPRSIQRFLLLSDELSLE